MERRATEIRVTNGHREQEHPLPPVGVSPLEMIAATLISLKDPERVVVENVDWKVETGDFWAIGGLQASGKSDVMATAAGLLPPAQGACRVFGREVATGFAQEDLAARRRVGLVFDGGQLLHHLTLVENISLPLRYHRDCSASDCAAQVDAWLEATELTFWAKRYPGEIARSRQQRAGLVRALVLKPELLLLDSPLTGLDPRDAAWWLEMLTTLWAGHPLLERRPLTLVVTGDDLRPWKGRARQFAVLRDQSFVLLSNEALSGSSDDLLLRELVSGKTPSS